MRHAFGSSYQREVNFTEHDWLSRISRGTNFLAYAGEPAPAGIVGAEGHHRVQLPSHPQYAEIAMARLT
jgi:hypothetical protein